VTIGHLEMIKVLGNIKKESFHRLKNKPNTQPFRDEIWSLKKWLIYGQPGDVWEETFSFNIGLTSLNWLRDFI